MPGSSRFVRASKYRHVHGQSSKTDKYMDIRPHTNGDSNYIATNGKYFALSISGGGGPVLIHSLDKPGRIGAAGKRLAVHKGYVCDKAFSLLNPSLLATGSEDCTIGITQIPDDLKDNITVATAKLVGHEKKVTNLAWHPTADNVLATGSADHMVKLWDIEKQAEILSIEQHENRLFSVNWNGNGSQLVTSSSDKTSKVFDPRDTTAVATLNPFTGSKKSTAFFMNTLGYIGCVGFTKSSDRQIVLYDQKMTDKPLATIDLDQSAGVLMPFFDDDTGVLFLAGKGDSSIKYYEIVKDAPFCHFLAEWRDTTSHKGITMLPKTSCDTTKCEIASALRVLRDEVQKVSLQVPRKSDMFQKDIFPDTYAGEAVLSADQYFAGENKDAPTISMKPGEGGPAKVAKKLVAKKSPAELQKELDAALARIAELEAEVAKLKA